MKTPHVITPPAAGWLHYSRFRADHLQPERKFKIIRRPPPIFTLELSSVRVHRSPPFLSLADGSGTELCVKGDFINITLSPLFCLIWTLTEAPDRRDVSGIYILCTAHAPVCYCPAAPAIKCSITRQTQCGLWPILSAEGMLFFFFSKFSL